MCDFPWVFHCYHIVTFYLFAISLLFFLSRIGGDKYLIMSHQAPSIICHLAQFTFTISYSAPSTPLPDHPLQSYWPLLCQEYVNTGCSFWLELSRICMASPLSIKNFLKCYLLIKWPYQLYLILKSAPPITIPRALSSHLFLFSLSFLLNNTHHLLAYYIILLFITFTSNCLIFCH